MEVAKDSCDISLATLALTEAMVFNEPTDKAIVEEAVNFIQTLPLILL
jgi:hypothetical protein